MKKFFRFAAAAVAAIALFSCETPETPTPDGPDTPGNTEEPKVEYTEDIEFDLVVKEVEFDQVKVQVSHTGTKTDTWYYFATTETDIAKAVEDKVDELTAEATISGLKKTTKTTVTVRNLDPETEYNFVVFAIAAEGDVYGTYNSVEFKTAKEKVEGYNESDNWKMTYERDEMDGEPVEVIYIECAEDLTYYVSYIDKETFETYEFTNETYAQYALEEEYAYYAQYYDDMLHTGPKALAFERFISGEYLCFAVGCDAKGESTGYYSVLEFEVIEEEATAEYTKWLGTHTITTAPYSYEYDGQTVDVTGLSYDITVHPYDNNFKYIITGWECGQSDLIYTDFTEQGFYFVASYYDGMLLFDEVGIADINDGQNYFGLWGTCNLTANGQTQQGVVIALEGATMGIAYSEDNAQTATVYGNKFKYGSYDIEYTGMQYMGYPYAQNGQLMAWNETMMFPMTMEKVSGYTQQSVMPVNYGVTDLKTMSKKNIERRVDLKKEISPLAKF